MIRIQGKDAQSDTYYIDGEVHSVVRDGVKVETGDTLFITESGKAIKAKNAGISRVEKDRVVVIHEGDTLREYIVPTAYSLRVKDGDLVVAGQALTEGSLNPSQVLELRGFEAAQKYIVTEVQDIYISQGQMIHDKHIEIIVRQMFSKVRIEDPGDTAFVVSDVVDKSKIREINDIMISESKRPATWTQLLMGITKISLNTDSWLAAASFQETTRVLIEAATTAKIDYLRGLKENVIIGKLIPAGTGFRKDRAQEKTIEELTQIEMAE